MLQDEAVAAGWKPAGPGFKSRPGDHFYVFCKNILTILYLFLKYNIATFFITIEGYILFSYFCYFLCIHVFSFLLLQRLFFRTNVAKVFWIDVLKLVLGVFVVELPRFVVEPGIKLVGLGLYIEEYKLLAFADLHIGYEEALADQGVFLPPLQLGEIKEIVKSMVEESDAQRVVIVGDVKHEFGDILRQEWRETIEFLEFLKGLGIDVEVVRGNHDNYLVAVLKRLNISFHDPYLIVGKWMFFHGHKPLPVEGFGESVKYVVMGHEHPAILLRDELGARVKLKAFLVGEYMGKKIFVLPAVTPLMPGTEVNYERRIMSPLLREADLDSFRVYAVDLDAGFFDFGTLGVLREVSSV